MCNSIPYTNQYSTLSDNSLCYLNSLTVSVNQGGERTLGNFVHPDLFVSFGHPVMFYESPSLVTASSGFLRLKNIRTKAQAVNTLMSIRDVADR